MRSFFLVLSSLFICKSQAQNPIDVLHYKYTIGLSDNNDTIYGQATIHFKAKAIISTISLDLASINKGKGMSVTAASSPYWTSKPTKWTHENNKLVFPINKNLYTGDTTTVSITYKGIPADGLIISKNQFGKRTFFADNWPNRAHNWIPCVDDPADKATVEFIVTAPSHYQVISNGVQVEETNLPGNKKLTHYKEDVPLPTKVMVIGAADFAVSHVGTLDCIPVSSWVYTENRDKGFYDYAIGKDILAYFINYIGPYPYKKLANVQSKTRFGGMENAGAIFYNETTVTGKREEERLFAHEIVHQWFGNSATEKSFAHFWLSEGFATYLTHIFLETKYGIDSLAQRMRDDREEIIDFVKRTQRPVVDTTTNFMSLLNANSYQKGSWVLHMLRRELGDPVFHKGIRAYYAGYAGKNADTKDLQKIFESVSGKNLEQFFKQWLYTPENPSLDISWQYDEEKKEVLLHVKQLQNAVFDLPLTVSLTSESGRSVYRTIRIDKKEADFNLSYGQKPKEISTDPFVALLFEAKITELH